MPTPDIDAIMVSIRSHARKASRRYRDCARTLLREAETIFAAVRRISSGLVDISGADADFVDGASNHVEAAQMQASLLFFRGRLADIDQALAGLTNGKYGICEQCGQPIPPERLTVLPGANFCVECQRVREKSTATRRIVLRLS